MKCFYHNADLDGKCSAAIVHYAHPDVELIGINYGDVFPWDSIKQGERIYMVDFSLQPFEDMCRLANISDLIWIDHHKTAIEEAKKSGRYFRGLHRVGLGACALVWEWFTEHEGCDAFQGMPVPEPVRLLAEYDVWDHSDEECLPFQYGMRERNTEPSAKLWRILFRCMSYNGKTYQNIVYAGSVILKYEKRQNATHANVLCFETQIDGYRVIAANRGLGNSSLFDSVWDPDRHDIMCLFVWSKDHWKISLYSYKEDIDVSAVAKKRGGGGHKGAAGFQCSDIEWLISP